MAKPDLGPPERGQHIKQVSKLYPVLGKLTRSANSTLLDAYLDRGYLHGEHESAEAGLIRWQAGDQFRADYERGSLQRLAAASMERVDGAKRDITEFQVAARRRHDEAVKAIGRINAAVIERVAVWGERIQDVEISMGWRAKFGMPRLWEALDELARHYVTIRY